MCEAYVRPRLRPHQLTKDLHVSVASTGIALSAGFYSMTIIWAALLLAKYMPSAGTQPLSFQSSCYLSKFLITRTLYHTM